jgi:pyruvate/2-oxoglutarate dehydrogenase complex dihydrolipoamide acyltransferase (E2) component
MKLFSIDADNTITTFAAAEQLPEGQEHFATEKELATAATNWPADRLVQVWNSFAGVAGFGADLKPVKKFTDRKSAVARIFKAIQKLDGAPDATPEPTPAPAAAPAKAPKAAKAAEAAPAKTSKPAKPAKAAKPAKKPATAKVPREFSKKAIVLDLLKRKTGATMAEIAKATDWQNHTIRGFISGTLTKKMGLAIESTKSESGDRTYRLSK